MIPADQKSLLAFLKEEGRDANIQQETDQIYEVLKAGPREFPMFIRIMEDATLIQILAFFPAQVKKECAPEIARLLHLLNKELDIPGFGLDEQADVTFYRCMIPTVDKKIPKKILQGFLNSIQVVCETFSPAVEAVAGGHASFEELLEKAEKEKLRLQKSAEENKE